MWGSVFTFYLNVEYAIRYAIYMNIFGWVSQFIGPYYFEGNRPALMDSIVQAFITAPLFVYLEVLELLNIKYEFYDKEDKDADDEKNIMMN